MDAHPVNVGGAGGDFIAGETYSRSSVIQQLSLLLGCLNSLGPSKPAETAAPNIKRVIKKVLDHVLNSSGPVQTSSDMDSLDFTLDWNTFAQFNPLDNMDWLTESWGLEESS